MIEIYRKLFDLLDARERRRFYQLLALIVAMALIDMAGVAAILPFLAAVANPGKILHNRLLSVLYKGLGFSNDQSFLIFLGAMVFAVILLGLIVKSVTVYAIARFSHYRNHSISSRLLQGYLRQPYVWFLRRHSADLGRSILDEVNYLVGSALVPAMRMLAQAVSLTTLTALLFLVNPVIALSVLLVLGGSYVAIFMVVRRALTRLGKRHAEANKDRFKIAQEVIGGIKDVKILGLEETYLGRFRVPSAQVAASASASQAISEMPRNFLETIAFGGMVLLIMSLLASGNGSLGSILPTLGVFAFAGLRMFPAIQQVYHSLSTMRYTGAVLDNVHRDMLETQANGSSPPSVHRDVAPLGLNRQIELADLGYSYPGSTKPVLNGLSLEIQAQTTVGIVGGTGAGKTTAVDVILGLLEPQAGELRVDGVRIGPDNLRAWQNAIGYVPQQIFLVDDSVAANIAFGIPPEKVDRTAVERAARVANLHDFVVNELPNGYETEVGERGVRLSGGQRQRIGIARALYHDPEVLILDEATSALDNITERAVMEAVHNLSHEKTIIMIAHRLSTVRACDTIFLMEKGRLAAQGSYDQLVAENETFRRMATG